MFRSFSLFHLITGVVLIVVFVGQGASELRGKIIKDQDFFFMTKIPL